MTYDTYVISNAMTSNDKSLSFASHSSLHSDLHSGYSVGKSSDFVNSSPCLSPPLSLSLPSPSPSPSPCPSPLPRPSLSSVPSPLDVLDSQKINNLRKMIDQTLELDTVEIPHDIKISTMTLEAKLNTRFYPWNIYKYIRRSTDGILIGNENRDKKNKKAKNKNKQSEVFLNQVTISIIVSKKTKPVSVKIFNSGTIHFTGCVCADDLLEAVYKLCIECRREIAIIDKNGKIKDIKFAKNIDELKVENLFGFKVDMINCIFVVPFKIDRPKLQGLLKIDGFDATYDSNGHAGVRIKYISVKKKITIFVFESGSVIIILGNQGFARINEVHTFIYKYLLENYCTISKNDNITTSSILKYLEKNKK